ncbi:MAG: MATE family efflux transporter [Phycisphaerales bacterium]
MATPASNPASQAEPDLIGASGGAVAAAPVEPTPAGAGMTSGAEVPPGPASEADPDHPLREIFRVAAPSVATMTSYTAMQFIDALMVARIDPTDDVYLSAQGNGGLAAWIPMSICAGLVSVVNTYVAQNLGAGSPARGSAYGWNGIWIAAFVAILMFPYALALPALFAWAGHAPRLIDLEVSYANILIAGAFVSMSTRAISQYFYGMHRPNIVLIAAVAGNLVNILFNWILIYGNLGAPALGVVGAAIATLIGSGVELAIPMCVFLGPTFNRDFGTRAAWPISFHHLRDIWKIGWPGALTFGNEMICWGYFVLVLVASFGEHHNTATWVVHRYMHLSFMPAVGISFAMTAIIGRYLGMGRPDLAAQRARLGIALSAGYMGLCGLAFVLFRGPMTSVFSSDPAVIDIALNLLLIAALFQLFDGLGITIIGILRGAGDTVWPGVVTVALSWLLLAGGGHLASRLFPEWGSLGPWAGAAAYIIALGLYLLVRFTRGKWKTMKLVERPGVNH